MVEPGGPVTFPARSGTLLTRPAWSNARSRGDGPRNPWNDPTPSSLIGADDLQLGTGAADSLLNSPAIWRAGGRPEPPRPAIHRERLTAQELLELAQEPDFVAAAEIMRTKLASPVADGAVADRRRNEPADAAVSLGVSARSAPTGRSSPART